MDNFQKICPHLDCRKMFYVPIFKQNILFCPYCEQSLLYLDSSISSMRLYLQSHSKANFFEFLLHDITHHVLRYSLIIGVILSISYGLAIAKFHTSIHGDMIKILVCAVLLLGLIIFSFSLYCDGKGNKSAKGSKNPLRLFGRQKFVAGVDRLKQVENKIGINATLSHLKTGTDKANMTCQNCQSQRLIKYIFLGDLQKNYQNNPSFGQTFQDIDLDKFEYKSQVLCLNCQTLFEQEMKSSTQSGWEIVFNCLFLPILLTFGDYLYDKNSLWQSTGFILVVTVFAWMMAKFFSFQEYKSRYQNITL